MKLYQYKDKPALPFLILIISFIPFLHKNFIKKDIYTLSKTSAIVAFPFWLWAIFNTINGKKDLGVISFGSVLLSFLKCNGFLKKQPKKNICKNLFIFSSLLVTINYAIAFSYLKNNKEYYGFSTCFWFFITLLFFNYEY